ncbi:DUF1385 domain-containing protein [Candidatus Woesearchaeota archaeon]|nr:DUF1385 domain-containing protein [Candidatus Woesearchaeota archaeon]
MHIGGQAVVEGVMMRNQKRFAVAVRLPNGKIKLRSEETKHYPKWAKYFFIRGIVGLLFTLFDGISALIWSGNQQLGKEEQMSKKELFGTLAFSLLIGAVVFIALPFFAARFLAGEGFLFDILDGIFRVVIFLGYLLVISCMKDVQRLFQYHGAEHKTIACYEAGGKLNIKNIQQHYSRIHHRCGTAFLFIVLLLSVFFYSFVDGAWWVKLGGRIILLPIIAGLGYELLKLGDRFQKNILMKLFVLPGLWLQQITTKEPSDDQVEVAMKALEGVVKGK